MLENILKFLDSTGIAQLTRETNWWQYLIMYVIIGALFYLAIVKKFEPLLLMPIAFGMLLANLPGANLIHLDFFFDDYYISFIGDAVNPECLFSTELQQFLTLIGSEAYSVENGICTINLQAIDSGVLEAAFAQTLGDVAVLDGSAIHIKMTTVISEVINNGGLVDILYLGVKLGIYPSLIFLGVGAMTDFTPLIANPKSLFMGAGAQIGVFVAFFGALLFGFTPLEAGAIGIIGGADGPTAILVTKELAPHLLGAIAIAAYSYMALIPIIQPPVMNLLTTKKERSIRMTNLRPVSKLEKVIFPIVVTLIVVMLVPDAAS